jgi:hypothetical protein
VGFERDTIINTSTRILYNEERGSVIPSAREKSIVA